jgi:phosphatidylinositol kinase/protein kinase (PI-3  family)
MIGLNELLATIEKNPEWDNAMIVKELKARLSDLATRRKKFADQMKLFSDGYDRTMLNEFYLYWTESDRSTKPKMRFEKEATWETGRRLARWYRNNI